MIKNQISLVKKGSFIGATLLLILLLTLQISTFGQGKQISGTVYDQSGETLPGVNVVVKGTTNGTITTIDGTYSILVPEGSNELLFSFVGYTDQTVVIGNKSQIDVTLDENVQEMDEVIVVGYGTQKKSDLTGSVASVNMDQLERLPSTRVDEALQGQAAGVIVLQNSGQPGSSPAIRIRGLATINGGSPLVVIDGITGGSLANLNPNDIASIEVLKDAASQSIYGSAGGNGVILVTTKQGSQGKLQTKLNLYTGIQQPWKTDLGIANSQEYAAIYNQYQQSKGLEDYFPQNDAGTYLDPTTNEELQNIDWINEVFRTAIVQNYNLSVSGGNKISKFFMGANYIAEDGIVKKTSNDRLNFRLNSEHKIFDKVTIGENFNFSQNARVGQSERNEYSSPLSTAVQMLPFIPIYAEDGSGNYAYQGAGLSCNVKSPLAQIEYNNNLTKTTNLFGNAYLKIDLMKGLTFQSRFGMSYGNTEYLAFTPIHDIGNQDNISPSLSVTVNQFNRNVSSNHSWQWQNFINYNFTVLDKNNFNVTLGTESGYSYNDFTNKTANGVDLETENWKSYTDTTGMYIAQQKEIETSGYAYFLRLTYDYDGILLLQGNFRRDYSSKFGPNNRVGNFPSISAGLKFTEFDFMKDLSFINFGKLRVGYGATGNSDIQPFLYLNTVGSVPMNGYPFGGVVQPGASLLTAANPDLKWETVVTQNIGLDLRFLDNRLGLSVDAFSRKNVDMLLRKSVPLTVGYIISDAFQELGDAALDTRPLVNYGTLDNRGFELSASYKDQIGDFKFEINANLTHAKTVIDDIGDPLYAGSGRGFSNVCQTKNGEPVSAFYGYKTDGLYKEEDFSWHKYKKRWKAYAVDPNGSNVIDVTDLAGNESTINVLDPENTPGNFRFVDANGDGTIDPLDMVNIGDPNPDFVYGFGGNMEYKNFDLNFFFQGSYGNDIFNMLKVNTYAGNNGGLSWSKDLINSYVPAVWDATDRSALPVKLADPKNTDTGVASMDANLISSDFFVEDGSYLRLKNIQLGYTVPTSVLNKIKIARMRVYIGAKNLLTFTKYSGFDPEVGETSILERGFDRGTYPQAKMYTIGLNLAF